MKNSTLKNDINDIIELVLRYITRTFFGDTFIYISSAIVLGPERAHGV